MSNPSRLPRLQSTTELRIFKLQVDRHSLHKGSQPKSLPCSSQHPESAAEMLILIAGITGMVGQPCAEAAIARGHQVRGIGRDPEKLPAKLRQQLESFVTSSGIYDMAALERAVANVDAVICAYGFQPECLVEGQLLLLRAAERAGVKVGRNMSNGLLEAWMNENV